MNTHHFELYIPITIQGVRRKKGTHSYTLSEELSLKFFKRGTFFTDTLYYRQNLCL